MTMRPEKFIVPRDVAKMEGMTIKLLLLYEVIYSFWSSGCDCFAHNKYLMDETGYSSKGNLNKAILKLEEMGLIKRINRNGGRILTIARQGKVILEDKKVIPQDYQVIPEDYPSNPTGLPGGSDTISINRVINNKGTNKSRNDFGLPEMLESNLFDIPEQMLRDWQANRKAKKAPITATVWKGITNRLKDCQRANLEPVGCFELMVERGWQSINLEYIAGSGEMDRLKVAKVSSQDSASEWDIAAQTYKEE